MGGDDVAELEMILRHELREVMVQDQQDAKNTLVQVLGNVRDRGWLELLADVREQSLHYLTVRSPAGPVWHVQHTRHEESVRDQRQPPVNKSRTVLRLQREELVSESEHHVLMLVAMLESVHGIFTKNAGEQSEEDALVEGLASHDVVMVQDKHKQGENRIEEGRFACLRSSCRFALEFDKQDH